MRVGYLNTGSLDNAIREAITDYEPLYHLFSGSLELKNEKVQDELVKISMSVSRPLHLFAKRVTGYPAGSYLIG